MSPLTREELEDYKKRAKEGELWGQFVMGSYCYMEGGSDEVMLRGGEWYKAVIDNKKTDPDYEVVVSGIIEIAFGSGRSMLFKLVGKEILQYITELGENGNACAERNLAGYYAINCRNYEDAFKWRLRAAEHGEWKDMREVSRYYLRGLGTEKDLDNARLWFVSSFLAHIREKEGVGEYTDSELFSMANEKFKAWEQGIMAVRGYYRDHYYD